MTIWILVLLCLGFGAGSGRAAGAVRTSIALLGTWIAYMAAMPLGDMIRPHTMTFFKTPTTLLIVPPLVVLILLFAVFCSIAQGVGFKTYYYYKYKTTDEKRVLWERLNANWGLCLGLFNGVLWLGIVLAFIYSVGYPIMLSQPASTAPATYRFMAKARADLKESGFEKFAAAMDRTPESFYQGSEVIGLMYQNPPLQGRLLHYPLFLSLSGTPEFVKMLAGPETKQILDTKSPITTWFNTNSMKLLNNTFIKSQLKQIDTADLLEFAKTGKSPKYDPEVAIGIWEINLAPMLNAVKQNHPSVTPVMLVQLKRLLAQNAHDVVLVNTPDGQMFLRSAKLEFAQLRGLIQARVVPRAGSGQPEAPPPPGPQPAVEETLSDITQGTLIASGRWTKEGETVNVSLKSGDNEATGNMTILNEDNIVIKINEGTLIFSRYR